MKKSLCNFRRLSPVPRLLRWGRSLCLGLALTTLSAFAAADARPEDSACVDAVSYWPLEAGQVGRDGNGVAALGTYERVSPDGRFVLRSYSGAQIGQVSLIELPLERYQSMRIFRTPLSNEAFPVQGSWRYLVDVDGSHFRLADVLGQQAQARPLFKGGMSGFYAAASELTGPGGGADGSLVWIRSMSWPQGGRGGQGTGPLQVRTLGVRDKGASASIVQDTGAQFICASRSVTDGNVYTLPMISVDGLEFSAIPINPAQGAPSMRVYGLGARAVTTQHPCDLRSDLQATPGKAVFGFPTPGAPAMLTYTQNGSVFFVDRRPEGRGQEFRIEDLKTRVLASAFPGITADGRIVFGATWQNCDREGGCREEAGYVIADPFQNPDYRQHMVSAGVSLPKRCITREEVRRAREAFAALRGIAS